MKSIFGIRSQFECKFLFFSLEINSIGLPKLHVKITIENVKIMRVRLRVCNVQAFCHEHVSFLSVALFVSNDLNNYCC